MVGQEGIEAMDKYHQRASAITLLLTLPVHPSGCQGLPPFGCCVSFFFEVGGYFLYYDVIYYSSVRSSLHPAFKGAGTHLPPFSESGIESSKHSYIMSGQSRLASLSCNRIPPPAFSSCWKQHIGGKKTPKPQSTLPARVGCCPLFMWWPHPEGLWGQCTLMTLLCLVAPGRNISPTFGQCYRD